jgi:hypothetical protein
LFEFKAGKMNLAGPNAAGKFSCSADKRKGTISLVSTSDQLVHFRWSDRTSGNVEDDRIIFPGDATLTAVKTGRDDDRVYILKMNSGGPNFMYWMQDKSNEKDKENIDKLNDLMTNPSAVQAAIAANAASAPNNGLPAGMAAPPGMGPEAWAQLMGLQAPPGAASASGGGAANPPALPASAAAAAAAATSTTAAPSSSAADAPPPAPVGGLDFSNLLSTLGNPSNAPPAAPAATTGLTAESLRMAMAGAAAARQEPLELQDIYQADAVLSSGVLEDEEIRAELISQLPEGQQSQEHLETALRSPQLRDAMRSLSRALNPENYASVMANFGLDPGAGGELIARGEAVQAFLAAFTQQQQGQDSNNMDSSE